MMFEATYRSHARTRVALALLTLVLGFGSAGCDPDDPLAAFFFPNGLPLPLIGCPEGEVTIGTPVPLEAVRPDSTLIFGNTNAQGGSQDISWRITQGADVGGFMKSDGTLTNIIDDDDDVVFVGRKEGIVEINVRYLPKGIDNFYEAKCRFRVVMPFDWEGLFNNPFGDLDDAGTGDDGNPGAGNGDNNGTGSGAGADNGAGNANPGTPDNDGVIDRVGVKVHELNTPLEGAWVWMIDLSTPANPVDLGAMQTDEDGFVWFNNITIGSDLVIGAMFDDNGRQLFGDGAFILEDPLDGSDQVIQELNLIPI